MVSAAVSLTWRRRPPAANEPGTPVRVVLREECGTPGTVGRARFTDVIEQEDEELRLVI